MRGRLRHRRRADIDLDVGTVRIEQAMKRGEGARAIGIAAPKTRSSRRALRLAPPAIDALRRRRSTQAAERLAAGPVWTCGTVTRSERSPNDESTRSDGL